MGQTWADPMEFDYIICGDGSSGSVLAARLSQDAGVSGRPPIHNWALHSTRQPGLQGQRGFQPRGKALERITFNLIQIECDPRQASPWDCCVSRLIG